MIEQHLTDVIGTIVTATAEALDINIKYMYGDVNEVVNRLSIMSKTPEAVVNKYPLFAMFTDIPEKRETSEDIQSEVVIPTIVIATFTKSNYHSTERMEKSIKLILHPIYEAFLEQLRISNLIKNYSLIPHTKVNRLSWGQSAIFTTNNAGSDFIDAIEIKDLSLKIIKKIC